jgi:hypothetical protein
LNDGSVECELIPSSTCNDHCLYLGSYTYNIHTMPAPPHRSARISGGGGGQVAERPKRVSAVKYTEPEASEDEEELNVDELDASEGEGAEDAEGEEGDVEDQMELDEDEDEDGEGEEEEEEGE